MRVWRSIARALQLVTGVHRIHHVRWSYGWSFPLTSWAYFPPTVRYSYLVHDQPAPTKIVTRVGWRRLRAREYHDCTKTGRR